LTRVVAAPGETVTVLTVLDDIVVGGKADDPDAGDEGVIPVSK
jgi:hypothetical protein